VYPARLTALGGLFIAIAVGRPLGAQDRSVVELGVSLIHFSADSINAIGPSGRWTRSLDRGVFAASGSIGGVAGPDGAAGSLDLSSRRLQPLGAGWLGELSGELGALLATATGSSSANAMSGVLAGRLLRPFDDGGAWLRGSLSASRRSPDLLPGQGIGAGVWWRWPAVRLEASGAREWNVAQLFTGPRREGYAGTVPVAYTEGSVGIQVQRDDATFAVSGTVRRDPGAEHLVERGASVTAALWQTPTRAFVVSVASQLPDFVHGGDAAQSVSLGVRLNEASPALERVLRTRPILQVSGDSAARTVRVRAPGARRVEIMGDFSEWEPVELAPAGDVFSGVVPMAAGTRRIVVRVDGGAWRPAANTPAVDDDFGGRVGLLLVP